MVPDLGDLEPYKTPRSGHDNIDADEDDGEAEIDDVGDDDDSGGDDDSANDSDKFLVGYHDNSEARGRCEHARYLTNLTPILMLAHGSITTW